MKTRLTSTLILFALALLAFGCAMQTRKAATVVETPPETTPDPRALDHFIRGVVLDQQGEVTRAISEYRRALKYDSTAASIYLALAEDYVALKLYDDAMLQLYAALQLDSTNVAALEFLSDLMLEAGQFDSAISLARRLITLNPDEIRYKRNLAGIFLRLNQPAEAIIQYEEILKQHPDDAETLSQMSSLYIALKDFQKALDVSRRLYALDSTDDRVNFTIASLLAELKRPAEADSFFARAIDLNPDDPRYFTNWAYLHISEKDYLRAIDILHKGALHHPRAAEIWAMLGSAYERAGQDSSALKALDHALELDATQLGPYITLGYIYDDRGEFEKALEVYNQALAIAPDDPLLLNNYAYLLAQRKIRLDEALDKVQRALVKSPDNPSYLDTMGWVYFGLGDYQKAMQFLRLALEKDAENGTILEHLGDVYEALGDRPNARAYWLKSLDFDPNNAKIREKLAK